MDFCFLCPSLGQFGYETGFSIRNPFWSKSTELDLQISRFDEGRLLDRQRIVVNSDQYHVTAWESDWGQTYDKLHLLVIELFKSGSEERISGISGMEGQMLFRNTHGWTSSLISGFVPYRPADYRFSPIVHTAHYFADRQTSASHTILLNRKRVDMATTAGEISIGVKSYAGKILGQTTITMVANDATAIALEDILDTCNVPTQNRDEGVNLLFSGGASQFSIFTLFQNRLNGSIGMEHSLAPAYYFPQMFQRPEIRKRLYSWLGSTK